MQRPHQRFSGIGIGAVLAAAAIAALAAPAVAAPSGAAVSHVRSVPSADLGAARPTSLAFSASDGALLVGQRRRGRTLLRRFDLRAEKRRGTLRLPRLGRAAAVAVDPVRGRVFAVGRQRVIVAGRGGVKRLSARRLRLQDPRGATFAADGRTLYILDDGADAIVRVPVRGRTLGRPTRVALEDLDPQRLRGLAFNSADGLFYVLSPARGQLLAFDAQGTLTRRAELRSLLLQDPRAIAFAPSPDTTDHPAATRLYIADRGGRTRRGRVVETTVQALSVAARLSPTQVQASLVQIIDTSKYSPSSPDPSGVAYVPSRDRLLISDGEVEEMSIYQGINLWDATRFGAGTGEGTTYAYSREPTGLSYNPNDATLLVGDDDADRITVALAGADGAYGTGDDVWSRFLTSGFGSKDPEGLEYDTATGRLWICDGVGTEVYWVDPVNGTFGDGDDRVGNFDIAAFGAKDCEGIGVDVQRGTVLALDPSTKRLYESTREGSLVRTIDLSVVPGTTRAFAGVTLAPTSSGADAADAMAYWVVDRAVDNGVDPNENDGKLYELTAQSADALPTVSLTEPADGATVSGSVALRATASDDQGVTAVQFLVDGLVVATDTDGSDGWGAAWDSTAVADGAHTVTATAQDTAGQTRSASSSVTVDNVAPDTTPPAVALTHPAAGATVSGTIAVAADATDDAGVTGVEFRAGSTTIGTDADGSDGWSVAWNTTTVANGTQTLTAIATDAAGNSATSAPVSVEVSNSSAPVLLSVPIRTGTDDADETVADGAVRRFNGDLELGSEQRGKTTVVGLRFDALQLPQGARIVSAHVQFTADERSKPDTSLTIEGESTANAPTFSSTAFDITSRKRTAASVPWTPPRWLTFGAAGPDERTPDIGSIIQEIVADPAWASGNAAALIFSGSGRRTAESYEGGFPPVLRVEYTR